MATINWKFKFYDSDKIFDFCGIEKHCDIVKDERLKLVYLICYQKHRTLTMEKELNDKGEYEEVETVENEKLIEALY